MWQEPYLETCCRAALHRLVLAGAAGRPEGEPKGEIGVVRDGPCLERLRGMGLVRRRTDGRFEITSEGVERHAGEVLRRRTTAACVQA